LIFDEVVTGFRLAKGGATEIYGIEPDLLTYGKIIGGGCPAGSIAGKSEIMKVCDPSLNRKPYEVAQHGGTFCGNPLTMTAGYTTLKILNENPEIYVHINRLGEKARIEIDNIFKEEDIPTQTTGTGSMFITHFFRKNEEGDLKSFRDIIKKTDRERMLDYYLELMNHNIFFLPRHIGMVSSIHSEKDISKLVEASKRAVVILKKKRDRDT
jgi:glutamate-1-semialdehyde 2,1-aminomutase